MYDKLNGNGISRRSFIKTSAAISLGAMSLMQKNVYAAGSDKIRVGVIGCGGRGTGAALDCVHSSENVEIVALADLFQDRVDSSLAALSMDVDDKVSVTRETCFAGFDAYQKLLQCDLDMVILAAPPHFRPIHLKAAIEAGKHVFMEKPVAVDPIGVRSVIASSQLATEKNLCIVAGTQRRHQEMYLEIMNRIKDGAIGDIVSAQCYWNGGELWHHERLPHWSDMEYQCRNWLYYTWLSGDHIVEQHVHNIDIVNWAIGATPERCYGMGGRQVRTDEKWGNIYDHFCVDFVYPNDVHVMSTCRQTNGCTDQIAERIVGTKGYAYMEGPTAVIEGAKPYKFEKVERNPYEQEHADLIAAIRGGEYINEARRVAESTLSAIMGRMSTYTGRALKWDWAINTSQLDLSPQAYDFVELPVAPVAIPGQTQLV